MALELMATVTVKVTPELTFVLNIVYYSSNVKLVDKRLWKICVSRNLY